MSQESQQAIMHVLQQDSPILASLLGKLKQLNALQAIVALYVDEKLAARCQVANLENNCLTVITDSALWATRFRFQVPMLAEKLKLHPELKQLKDIFCKIHPAPNKHQPPKQIQAMPRLSAHSADLIRLAAKTIKDEKLQAIMKKIAQNTGHSES
jgi:hypothetical protein